MLTDAYASPQFAYNEMSFFLIRLLQNFSSLDMDLAAQPLDSRAPREWASAEGQQGKEKIVPKCLLTLFLKVRPSLFVVLACQKSEELTPFHFGRAVSG